MNKEGGRMEEKDTSRVKRRYFSTAQKVEILREFESGIACTAVAEKHRISPVLIYQWRRAMAKEGSNLSYKELLVELEAKKKKINHLEKAVSEFAVENQILKKALEIIKKNVRLKKWGLQKKL